MTVLDEIIAGVREDFEARRLPIKQLVEMAANVGEVRNPMPTLRANQLSIIAEVKRSSPSKGSLAAIADPAGLALQYERAGATVVSVLTEGRKFGGSLKDLLAVKENISLPVLRKDFMVDEYQFYEARAYGADLVLLIVAALSPSQLRDYYALTREIGMRAIVEVHSYEELVHALALNADIIGVNSRNLKDLSIHYEVFSQLLPLIPQTTVRVAESGISTRENVLFAQANGANALLIGEALVRGGNPEETMRALLGEG
jgi:indole-3-glycerol phosphate synthase